jgi:hypothetical protein
MKLIPNLMQWIYPAHLFQTNVAAAVVGTVAAAGIGAAASRSAADTQADAANNATAEQQAMYGQTQANLNPYMTQGSTALNTLNGDLNNGTLGGQFTNADLNANLAPNYAFQLQQGDQALQNSQASQDGVMSGAAQKQMVNFNQQTAGSAYQNAYNNWQSTQNMDYNQLSTLGSLGENAAAGLGNNGASISNGMANTITGAGNASAAGTIGQANALSNGISNSTGYYMLNNMMNPYGGTTANSGGMAGGQGFNGTPYSAAPTQIGSSLLD